MSTQIKRHDGGYFAFPNRWIDAGYMAKCPGSVTQVYLHLSRWADNSTWEAAQPMKLIAKKCGLSEDVTRKAVRVLEAWEVITRDVETGPNAVNVWHLNMLHAEAPDYPDKVPPKQSGVPKSGGPESGGPYQPNSYQPNNKQPDGDTLTRTDQVEELFEAFWSIYPRKVSKADARKAWPKALSKCSFPDLMDAVRRQMEANWKGREPQYIPHASSWLNKERWEDEIIQPQGPKVELIDRHGNFTVAGAAAHARGEI